MCVWQDERTHKASLLQSILYKIELKLALRRAATQQVQTSAPTQNPLRKATQKNIAMESHTAVQEEDSCGFQKRKAHSAMESHTAFEEKDSCAVALESSQHQATKVPPNHNLRRGFRAPPSEHRALKGPLEEVILSPLVQRWSRINGGGEREEVDTRGDGAVGCEEAVEAVAVEEALVHEIEGELTNCEDLGLTEVCQPVYQPVCQRVLIIASLNLTEPDQIQLNLTKHRGVRGPKQHTLSLPHFVRGNLSKP